MSDVILKTLKTSLDDDFFKCIEQCLGFIVPKSIQNILKFNYYNSAFTIAKIDENAISEIEEVMRSDFHVEMVSEIELPEYLCRYTNNEAKFKLIGGQRKLILAMAEYCLKVTNQKTVPRVDITTASEDAQNQDSTRQTANVNESNRSLVDTIPIRVNRVDIQDILKQLNKWMLAKSTLSKIFTGNLELKVSMSSLQVHPDGSISCSVHCPVEGCTARYMVTKKAYPTYYALEKTPNKIQKLAASKWNLSGMQNHLLKEHANDDEPANDDIRNDNPSMTTAASQSENSNDDVRDDDHSMTTGENQSQTANDDQPMNPLMREPQTDGVLYRDISSTVDGSQSKNAERTQTADSNEDAIVVTFDSSVENKQIDSQRGRKRKGPSTSQSGKLSKRQKVIPLKYR